MNFSIVIPTWNRSELVEALLETLYVERERYQQGETEVLIVDSSSGNEQDRIKTACMKFNATYVKGDDTEFVGKKTFWWKMLEKTSLVDSFSFARKYPFHSWTIGNNVSFKKSVLEEIGMFEENFPFKLGGDDLDMTYRVTKAGYMIGSAPNAVTYHSRKTWNNYKAVHDRAKRWGTMENFIVERHPELYKRIIPKNYILELIIFLCLIVVSLLLRSVFPVTIAATWIVANWIIDYVIDACKMGFDLPIYFFGAQIIQMQYEIYRVLGSLKKGSLGALYKGIIFNSFQIKFGMAKEAFRIKKLIWSFLVSCLIWVAYYQYFVK